MEKAAESDKKSNKKWVSNILTLIISFIILYISLKHKKIIFFIIVIIISIIIIIKIIFYIFNKKEKEKAIKAGFEEPWNPLYGDKILNVSYPKNNIIINTFKENGINYNKEIGNINNGEDYLRNERNTYNLFIPYSSLKNKDKYNGIILFIHGGAWVAGEKENIEYLCTRYSKCGYITAEMNHTLLVEKFKGFNIFRILDDITACIEDIKSELKNRGFNENKLELAIGGYSSGGHITLLYGYCIKNIPIPLKFLIDFVGPVTLDPKYWYKIKDNKSILENIEPEDIEKAFKEEKLIKVYEDNILIGLMNAFLGKKYTEDELKEMFEDKKIKENNEKYKELFNAAKYGFPTTYINSNSVPTLCEYGGDDSVIGVCHYSILKELSKKYGNKIVNVYMKNSGHFLNNLDNEDALNSMREIHYQILNFAKLYFTTEN